MIIKNLVRLKEVGKIKTKCYSLEFDGVMEYIDCGDDNAFSFGDGVNDSPFSISAWVNMTDAAAFRVLSKRSEPTNKEYAIYLSGAGTLVFIIEDKSTFGYEFIVTTNNFTSLEGQWINITGTYSGVGGSGARNGLELYVNGVIQTVTRSFSGSYVAMENTIQPVQIGRYDSTYAEGKIAGARMWNVELSAAEALSYYNEKNKPTSIQIGGLVLNTDISHSTFNGAEWDIPDLTGITAGYQTVLMEVGDRVLDCPRSLIPLNNLIVWLKGNAGINAGTPVDGDAIYQWQDQSGNNNHFVQATAIRQPEYKASLINGLPGVFVDGTTFLELLSQVIFSVDEGSVWIVAQQTAPPPNFINGGAYWTSTDGSFPPYMALYSERISAFGNDIVFYDQYMGKTQTLIAQDNLPHYIGLNKSSTDIDYFVDSSTVFANKAHVEDWTVYVEHFLGDQLGLVNGTMIGNICEFIVYDKVLSTSEVATITNYLTNKYGI